MILSTREFLLSLKNKSYNNETLCCNQGLTIIVSFDSADQAEELDNPTEALLHLKHKHTRQDLKWTHTHTQKNTLYFVFLNDSFCI